MRRSAIVAIYLVFAFYNDAVFSQQNYSNFNQFLDYVKKQSITIRSGDIKLIQAKKAKLAALLGVLDPSGTQSLSYTNNTRIPVQIIGGQAIETGVPYVTSFSQNGEIKILNLSGWENLKLAKLNINITENDNKLTLKNLYEQLATNYYNIVNINAQIEAAIENFKSSEILWQTAESKFKQGLVKQQDVNDAKSSYLSSKENIEQYQLLLEQQYLSLKILADIPEEELFTITEVTSPVLISSNPEVSQNDLEILNATLRERSAYSNYRKSIKENLPTLNFVFNRTSQQFNQESNFFDNNVDWIRSSYIGLRLAINIPSAATLSQTYKAKYDYELAKLDTEKSKEKAKLNNKQLIIEFDQATSQAQSNLEIYNLRRDSYSKNLNLYTQGIIGIDQTINSFNAMINANYNLISSNVNVLLALAKIEINNKIQ
ncbi:TolC family protein [Flavobacterium sp.]|uniref:TolC family protein n=1 Tax=Flavobacterium sp. TaxID=239 RepID=UPI00260ADB45|nr:TolC family protein [Flavobacterium sp.]